MLETEFIHHTLPDDPYHSLLPPIYNSSVYLFNTIEELIDFVSTPEKKRFEYGRYGNPTNQFLENIISKMESTEDTTLFASGMSACLISMLAFLEKGDHVILSSDLYLKTRLYFEKHLYKFGIEYSIVFPDESEILENIKNNTKIIFLEFPTNPFYYCVDLEYIKNFIKNYNIYLFVDSTLSSPVNANPILWGADVVIHSLTKYFSGQNDLIAGSASGKKEIIQKIREYNGFIGSILPAEISYRIIRSIKTMPLRVQHLNEKTLRIAQDLETHPKIHKVFYPLLPSHPDFPIAKKYLKGGGCLFTIELNGNLDSLKTFSNSTKIFKIGPSFASSESLLDPPLIMSHWDIPDEERKKMGITPSTIRISIGLESYEDLIEDIHQALEKI